MYETLIYRQEYSIVMYLYAIWSYQVEEYKFYDQICLEDYFILIYTMYETLINHQLCIYMQNRISKLKKTNFKIGFAMYIDISSRV